MTVLKTLVELMKFKNVALVEENMIDKDYLRAEAIKWIKYYKHEIRSRVTYEALVYKENLQKPNNAFNNADRIQQNIARYLAKIDFIENFFNISDEDLQSDNDNYTTLEEKER